MEPVQPFLAVILEQKTRLLAKQIELSSIHQMRAAWNTLFEQTFASVDHEHSDSVATYQGLGKPVTNQQIREPLQGDCDSC
jgi:hypothetical protein